MGIFYTLSTLFVSKNKNSKNRHPGGEKGEAIACRKLKQKGYRIIEKNFRTKYGEIDIIAETEKTICFIEVKARSSYYHGNPEEFVTKRKQKKLWRAASIFIESNKLGYDNYRFDVVSVDLKNNDSIIYTNAFGPDF